jgi:hypothetical protein
MILAGCSSPTPESEPAEPATTPPAQTAPAPAQPAMPAPSTGPVAPPATDQEMTASAMSAAPASVTRDATIIAIDANGQARTLREGTGPFTCLPDGPSPGVDPMCLDQNGLEWAKAWMGHETPPADKLGFGYMLAGGSDASNEDPFATEPAAGDSWVETGPHVMIFNTAGRFDGYPTTHDDPSRPYVMWPGTPYEHLMIPVR